ncbi:hypothetical protein LR48_Vigan08g119200 [Vigna angularis]|uniref:Uncharacterized protein n=1 Tax=Phaseolus angularis TaxID=3914 RepID=A0A0L9V5M8_PHAAN|nr:hypothetical protein LR48_Vigan627s008400 [Vigna angularis]KOM50365.1 hypothetical protein LR48_Vigan08g119200 [Vigna angularis]
MEPEEKEDSTGEGSEPVGEDQVLNGSLQEVYNVRSKGVSVRSDSVRPEASVQMV